jgi:hypothetical protein
MLKGRVLASQVKSHSMCYAHYVGRRVYQTDILLTLATHGYYCVGVY